MSKPPVLPYPPEQIEAIRGTAQMLAGTDPTFREALLRDPSGTLGSLVSANSGGRYELQSNLKIVPYEQQEGFVTVVIPSLDKASEGAGNLATLSRACAEDPALRAALKESPVQALQEYLGSKAGAFVEVPAGNELQVLLEDAGELLVVVPPAPAAATAAIATEELVGDGGVEPHMTCPTCSCPSAGGCPTGGCPSAIGCPSYSWDCR
jgi:hypothetical protein